MNVSTTRVGLSWEGAGNVWEKASVEAPWSEFPESAPLADRQRNLYVATKLRLRLLDMRYMAGAMTVEDHTQQTWQLDQMAVSLLGAAGQPTS